MLRIQILDPGFFYPWILDPDGMGKNPDTRSGLNIPDHISESLGSYFCDPCLGQGSLQEIVQLLV
jgi:hypothetical protein